MKSKIVAYISIAAMAIAGLIFAKEYAVLLVVFAIIGILIVSESDS